MCRCKEFNLGRQKCECELPTIKEEDFPEMPKCEKPLEVFCNECKYYVYKDHTIRQARHKCRHPSISEKERIIPNSPIKRGYIDKYTLLGECFTINENNDCELFEPKSGKVKVWST